MRNTLLAAVLVTAAVTLTTCAPATADDGDFGRSALSQVEPATPAYEIKVAVVNGPHDNTVIERWTYTEKQFATEEACKAYMASDEFDTKSEPLVPILQRSLLAHPGSIVDIACVPRGDAI